MFLCFANIKKINTTTKYKICCPDGPIFSNFIIIGCDIDHARSIGSYSTQLGIIVFEMVCSVQMDHYSQNLVIFYLVLLIMVKEDQF